MKLLKLTTTLDGSAGYPVVRTGAFAITSPTLLEGARFSIYNDGSFTRCVARVSITTREVFKIIPEGEVLFVVPEEPVFQINPSGNEYGLTPAGMHGRLVGPDLPPSAHMDNLASSVLPVNAGGPLSLWQWDAYDEGERLDGAALCFGPLMTTGSGRGNKPTGVAPAFTRGYAPYADFDPANNTRQIVNYSSATFTTSAACALVLRPFARGGSNLTTPSYRLSFRFTGVGMVPAGSGSSATSSVCPFFFVFGWMLDEWSDATFPEFGLGVMTPNTMSIAYARLQYDLVAAIGPFPGSPGRNYSCVAQDGSSQLLTVGAPLPVTDLASPPASADPTTLQYNANHAAMWLTRRPIPAGTVVPFVGVLPTQRITGFSGAHLICQTLPAPVTDNGFRGRLTTRH